MYDTDLEGSGGKSEALWKTTALMDGGNYNNDGRTPPYYNAIDRDMLGIGKPEELKEGKYKLEPVNVNGRFLKFAVLSYRMSREQRMGCVLRRKRTCDLSH